MYIIFFFVIVYLRYFWFYMTQCTLFTDENFPISVFYTVQCTLFTDENFAVSHSRRGMVGMANKGRHTNGSQFYITLQPTKWMDTKYVAFGWVQLSLTPMKLTKWTSL